MGQKLRMVLSLEEFEEDMVTIDVQSATGRYHDEIIGITNWRDKIVIATHTHIFLLERDNDMELRLQELAETNEQMLYTRDRRYNKLEARVSRDCADEIVSFMGLNPNHANDPRLIDLIQRIRARR